MVLGADRRKNGMMGDELFLATMLHRLGLPFISLTLLLTLRT